jgi:hypothetical protein
MRLTDTQHKCLMGIYDSKDPWPPVWSRIPTLLALQKQGLIKYEEDGSIQLVKLTAEGKDFCGKVRAIMGIKARPTNPKKERVNKIKARVAARNRELEKAAKEAGVKKGKRLDSKTHKLVEGEKAACGKEAGCWDMGVWTGGVQARDTWHFVDCKECLVFKPDTIHIVPSHSRHGGLEMRDVDDDGKRWRAKTACGSVKSPLETTTDQMAGGVNCLDCLLEVSPACRTHFKGGGGHTTTLCGAKTTAMNSYPTDSWWICTCPDCYRIKSAEVVHDLQVDDVTLLLNNSVVAARNRGLEISQERCGRCSGDNKEDRCLACAVLERRGVIMNGSNIEDQLSRILALPYEWVMDLLKGWDGDKQPELTYRAAYNLGKRLWRKHGEDRNAGPQRARS